MSWTAFCQLTRLVIELYDDDEDDFDGDDDDDDGAEDADMACNVVDDCDAESCLLMM